MHHKSPKMRTVRRAIGRPKSRTVRMYVTSTPNVRDFGVPNVRDFGVRMYVTSTRIRVGLRRYPTKMLLYTNIIFLLFGTAPQRPRLKMPFASLRASCRRPGPPTLELKFALHRNGCCGRRTISQQKKRSGSRREEQVPSERGEAQPTLIGCRPAAAATAPNV